MNGYGLKVAGYKALYAVCHLLKRADLRQTPLVIIGSARGGTTWLMELLYQDPLQVVWEPTQYETLREVAGLDFTRQLGTVPYIPETMNWPAAQNYFDSLLAGQAPAIINRNSHPLLLQNPFGRTGLLIKFCNAGLMLPWLTRHYPVKPIFLIRHPLAVVASQLRHPGFSQLDIHQHIFRINQSSYKDIFERFRQLTEQIDSLESLLANWWAIQQVLALEHPQRHERWLTVSYEKLFLQPEEELHRIAQWTGHLIPSDWQERLRIPSQTSGQLKPQVDGWRTQLRPDQVRRILDIVHAYGITMYSESAEPDYGLLYPSNGDEKIR